MGVWWSIYRGPGSWGRVAGAGGIPWAGAIYQPVKVPGIVPGGRPHGGGACAVYRGRRGGQDGGAYPARGRGNCQSDSVTLSYISVTVKKNRYTIGPKNGKMGTSRKALKISKNQASTIQYHLSYAADLYPLMQEYTVSLLSCIKSCIRIQKMDREKNGCKKQPKKGV